MHSNTNGKSKLVSRNGDFLEYRQNNDVIVGGKNPIGSTTIDQGKRGILFPTIQSAIDDLYSMTILPIGSILTNTTGFNPQGESQVTRIVFGDSYSIPEDDNSNGKYYINILGIDMYLNISDIQNRSNFITEVESILNENISNGFILSYLQKVDDNTYDVKFIDNQYHEATSYGNPNIITITESIISEFNHGYGTWVKLGQEEKFSEVIHYFKRIA